MNILILDDEELARKMLLNYCTNISPMSQVQEAKEVLGADRILQGENIDLLLLDINLGTSNGLKFLRGLQRPPLVILTTAYKEHALEGFELNVVDYLLKPISYERFSVAFNRAQIEIEKNLNLHSPLDKLQHKNIIIKDGYKLNKIMLKDIIRIVSMREYIVYHTANGNFMELKTLIQAEEDLPNEIFIRVHRSHLVPIHQIKAIKFKEIFLQNGDSVPIGKTYWKKVKKTFNTHL